MDATQRLARVSEELLRMREEEPIRLRVWEFESVADRRREEEDDATPSFGVDEPDAEARAEGLLHIGAKLHVEGVHGWAHIYLDLSEDEATVDRESYLNPDHCVRTRVPFALDDGYRLRGKSFDGAAGFSREVVRVLGEQLEDLQALQAREGTG